MSGNERRRDGTLDERVVEFVYGELSAADEAAFEKELEQRPDLKAQVAELTALQRSIDTIETPEPPAEVVADILAYAAGRNRVVRTEPVPEKRLTLADIFRWMVQPQVGMAMAAMLVVAVGVYMGQSARRPAEPGSAQEVKERMRPTRSVAKEKEPAAATATAAAEAEDESAPPASGKLASADEAVGGKVAQPLAGEVNLESKGQPATPPSPTEAPPNEERATEALSTKSPKREAARQMQEEPEATGEEMKKGLESAPGRATRQGKSKSAGSEEERRISQVAEESAAVALDGVAANLDTATGIQSSGGSAGLDAGQRKSGEKVAVRSLVDALDRRRDKRGALTTEDRWVDQGATKDANVKLDEGGLKGGDSSNLGLAGGPPVDDSVEMDDSTHKQVNIPRKERRKKVAEKSVAGKKSPALKASLAKESAEASRQQAPAVLAESEEVPNQAPSVSGDAARGEKKEWVGNTYNRAVEGEQASDGPMKPQEAAPVKPAATTSVSEGWGVVPTAVPSDSLVKPVSVNPSAGSEYTAVVEKGEVQLNFGDDGVDSKYRGESQAAPYAPETPDSAAAEPSNSISSSEAPVAPAAPVEPVMPASEDLSELTADEDSSEEAGEGEAPIADKVGSTDFAYKKVAVDEETVEAQPKEEEAKQVKTQIVDEKKAEKKKAEDNEGQKKYDKAATCDKYWGELLAFEKSGENGKALKLLKMFRSGPCAGTRSQNAMDMREASIYIASGKRNKARKVLKRLQKVPALEQKAMDMMESIEGDGYGQ